VIEETDRSCVKKEGLMLSASCDVTVLEQVF